VDAADLEDFKRLFREAFAFNAVQEYSAIHCPTLIMFGERDECVDPRAGLANIRAGFSKSGNSGLAVIVYPGAGHGLEGAGDKSKEDLLKWLTGPLNTCRQSATPSPQH
jgi:pimeloyl-ACP methyl ester carboxylesterase